MFAEKLTAFVKRELVEESENGFSRVAGIPDGYVQATVAFWRGLGEADRAHCLDALAVRGARFCNLLREHGVQQEHFFERQLDEGTNALRFTPRFVGVRDLRLQAAIQRMQSGEGVAASVLDGGLAHAPSIRPVKAPQLRKAVKAAFATLGLTEIEKCGGGVFLYHCQVAGSDITIGIDYGGLYAQLRYGVSLAPHVPKPGFAGFTPVPHATGMSLERTLGLSHGDWDLITEETLGPAMEALCDSVRYAAALPSRFASWIGDRGER